ncbi:hypothetical protein [Gimesia sp.]|uniref:hypothetical protein n=1 Tax=Gimesia sp. TaxID=2024833 RepID=UPI003A9130E8
MDSALCLDDDKIYGAENFSKLVNEELEKKRRSLVCISCKGPAYFRKASISGQAACFGARPHSSDCALASLTHETFEDGEGSDQNLKINPGDEIVVDLILQTEEVLKPIANSDLPPNSNRKGKYLKTDKSVKAQTHRRLSTLLHNLIHNPDFRTSQQTIIVDDEARCSVSDFFIQLNEITPKDKGTYRGCWGMISDANEGENKTIWFNSGGDWRSFSFCLDKTKVDPVFKKYKIKDLEDFAGAYILVCGNISESGNNKLYCAINSADHLVFELVKNE